MTEMVLQAEDAVVSNRVLESAAKLRRHIQASGLRPGDKYISAEDAGRLLGESVTTAQRAMAFLAQRRILERRPRAGTFIGSAVVPKVDLSCIHFLLPEQTVRDATVAQTLWSQVEGMRTVLPNLSVQLNFVPHQDVTFAKQIVERAGDTLTGVVLVLSSRPMRAFFNQSGIPTVVWGGVEPDLTNLCWLNWDQMQTGHLLGSYLLDRGHRRIATIMRDLWSVGEHQLHDGLGEVLAERGVPANTLLVRSAPIDPVAIRELTRSLLHEASPPTAFICRTELQADNVAAVAREEGVAGLDVTVCNIPIASEGLRYTCGVSQMSIPEMGGTIGRMFREMTQGRVPEPRGVSLPIRLHRVEG